MAQWLHLWFAPTSQDPILLYTAEEQVCRPFFPRIEVVWSKYILGGPLVCSLH